MCLNIDLIGLLHNYQKWNRIKYSPNAFVIRIRSNANYEFSLISALYRLCDVIVATMSRMDRGTKPTFDGKSQGK